MKKILILLSVTLLAFGYAGFMAAETIKSTSGSSQSTNNKSISTQPVSQKSIAKIQKKLQNVLAIRQPDLKLTNAKPSAIPGLLQMQIEGGPLVYVTNEGTHFFIGDAYAIKGNSFVNVTETEKNEYRKEFLSKVSPDEYISFAPVGKVKAVVNVFTDITCGYCVRLHREMDEINAYGIEVRYFAFPRAGINSKPYHDMVSAWCSDSPHNALNTLKAGGTIAPKTCDNPVSKHYAAGGAMGINGTPALLLQDGTLIPGYKPAKELAELLGVL